MLDHGTIVIEDLLYTWGGGEPDLPLVHSSDEKQTFTSKIKIFHLPTGQWNVKTTSGSPPLGVTAYSCTAVGEKIYYFGGVVMISVITTVSMNWIQSILPGNCYNLQMIIYL